MEPCSYFSGDKEYAFDKTVTASSENGGKTVCFEADHEKPSRVVVENISSEGGSSMVNLKLGSASNQKEILSLNSFASKHNSSNSTPKRTQSHVPFCQVYGCRKDLRSSKDYYKKHKVCEAHSKTAKVIVNGIEQRFCQQCSRFHMLAEFDNGKRSCRRRLAGHNKRRRKARVGVNSTRLRCFQDYNGCRFQDTKSTLSADQNRLTSGLLYQQKYMVDDWNRPVKLDHTTDFSPQIDYSVSSEQLHSKSLSTPYPSGKQRFPLFVGKNSETNDLCMQDHVLCSDTGSPSLFRSSVESKNSAFRDSPSNFQELPGTLNSGRAFSLLSSLSQDSSKISLRAHSSHPLVITSESDASCDLSTVCKKLLAVSHLASTSGVSGFNQYSS